MQIDLSQFDLVRRSDSRQLERQHRAVASWSSLRTLLEPLPNFIMVLNAHRQIVFANQALLSALAVADANTILGKRPGECLQCERAFETADGCGNSEACQSCGALTAILHTQLRQDDEQECRLLVMGGRPLEMRVKAFPVTIEGDLYTVLHATDLQNEKRRRALERTFFHDILNHAGAVKGMVNFLKQNPSLDEDGRELATLAQTAAEWLIESIHSQRDLLAAEEGSLSVRIGSLRSQAILRELVNTYQCHPCAEGRQIVVDPAAEDLAFDSDRQLLLRVLGNLIKNALEASVPGQTIRIGCRRDGEGVRFVVHNEAVMPPEVQHQIFRRSFSLKGAGRGLGTYSVRLFTQEYLRGQVSFTSRAAEGTTFTIRLPLKPA